MAITEFDPAEAARKHAEVVQQWADDPNWLPQPDPDELTGLLIKHTLVRMELTTHRQDGRVKGYRRSVGRFRTDGGQLIPRVMPLGNHLGKARQRAEYLAIWWDLLVDRLGDQACWTPQRELAVKTMADAAWEQGLSMARQTALMLAAHAERYGSDLAAGPTALAPQIPGAAPAALPAGAKPPAPPIAVTTLHAALDAYLESVWNMPGSSKYKRGISDSVAALKFYWADKPPLALDYGALETLTHQIKARPASRMKDRRSGKHQPIAPYTVSRLLQHARQAFTWIHRQRSGDRFGHWRMPEDAREELFSVRLTQLMSKAERDQTADGPEQVTVKQIAKLYLAIDAENTAHKIWFLLGLFTGQGQAELAVTRRDEFDLDRGRFVHRRNKTGQRGEYWLPDELVKLLRDYFRTHDERSDKLAFATHDGSPIVDDATNSDAVRQMWDDLRTRSRLDLPKGMGFYSLRRFGGDVALRLGGDALQLAWLSHSGRSGSVGRKHYSDYRDFAGVEQVGREIHRQVTTMIGAMRLDGMAALSSIEAATDGEVFLTFVNEALVPTLRAGDVVVLDNLTAITIACTTDLI